MTIGRTWNANSCRSCSISCSSWTWKKTKLQNRCRNRDRSWFVITLMCIMSLRIAFSAVVIIISKTLNLKPFADRNKWLCQLVCCTTVTRCAAACACVYLE